MENTLVVDEPAAAAEYPLEPVELAEPAPVPRRRVWRWLGRLLWRAACAIASAMEWLFGLLSLLVGLATLAALPLVQVLSLGYFLESAARVARTGRLRDGVIGARRAARSAAWLRRAGCRSFPRGWSGRTRVRPS